MTPAWTKDIANLTDTAMRGSMAGEFQQVKGMRADTVTFKTNCYLDDIFVLLRQALGLPDVMTGSSDPYTHKTSLQSGNNGQPVSSTVFFYDAQGKAWQMAGSQVSDLKLTISVDDLVTAEVTYIGLPAVAITPPTNTPDTNKPMPGWNSLITVGGTTMTKYSEIDLEIKRDTSAINTLNGTQAPFAIYCGACTVSGSFTGVYQGSTDNDLVAEIANTQPALVAKISPVGDAVHSITFQCTVVAYDQTVVDNGSKWVQIKSTIKGLANATDVAGSGNQSPMLATLLSPVSTAI
jgi:hypothetical protein